MDQILFELDTSEGLFHSVGLGGRGETERLDYSDALGFFVKRKVFIELFAPDIRRNCGRLYLELELKDAEETLVLFYDFVDVIWKWWVHFFEFSQFLDFGQG